MERTGSKMGRGLGNTFWQCEWQNRRPQCHEQTWPVGWRSSVLLDTRSKGGEVRVNGERQVWMASKSLWRNLGSLRTQCYASQRLKIWFEFQNTEITEVLLKTLLQCSDKNRWCLYHNYGTKYTDKQMDLIHSCVDGRLALVIDKLWQGWKTEARESHHFLSQAPGCVPLPKTVHFPHAWSKNILTLLALQGYL